MQVTLTAPATASVGGDVAVDVHLSGPDAARVAGFQATALVDAAGGDVVTAIPTLAGARILDPGATGGSATVGFFGGRPGSAPADVVAHVLVTPKADGRLQVRLSRPILVDAAGKVLKVSGGGDAVSIAVGSGQTVFHAPDRCGGRRDPGRTAEGPERRRQGHPGGRRRRGARLAVRPGDGRRRAGRGRRRARRSGVRHRGAGLQGDARRGS